MFKIKKKNRPKQTIPYLIRKIQTRASIIRKLYFSSASVPTTHKSMIKIIIGSLQQCGFILYLFSVLMCTVIQVDSYFAEGGENLGDLGTYSLLF